ncbi:hypothetical protein [Shinella zoogloeoides]|uniref:hypothetical protein n=1 Tax=Shinella zoogloeoides TaxID=352475 RepID=UPI00273FE622|nr:hypothetical protein [Shinella zoogloeoides]WLR90871.1 hypothetical protein Q9316_00410 [Shinella zoogloeoides]
MSELEPKPIKVPTIKVVQYIDPIQLKTDLAYSNADLSSAMMEQAAQFASYGVLAAQASMQVDKMKMLLENTEAEVARRERDRKALAGQKSTEGQISEIVTRHPRVIAAKKALNEAKQIESVGKIAVESFRHRRDMLVQQGLISREERKGELSVSLRNAKEEEMRSTQERLLARRQGRLNGEDAVTE